MSIKLVTDKKIAETSSKGNQEKWLENNRWYKLDMFGYEGLAENVTSFLLSKTNVEELGFQVVSYRMEKLNVHRHIRLGCSSENFLHEDESIITMAGLLKKSRGPGWQKEAEKLPNLRSKVKWLADQVTASTGLERFGEYLTLLFEVDMLFLNEDRHLNNIAILRRGSEYDYCPIFDFGAGLLSNIRDYPMDVEPKGLIRQAQARPLNCGFTRQVHAAQDVFGPQLRCDFTEQDVLDALKEPLSYYADRDIPYIRDRVVESIQTQKKKLFRYDFNC